MKENKATVFVDPWAATLPGTGAGGMSNRLDLCDFRIASTAHIVVDGEICKECSTQACVWACPAQLFVVRHDGAVVFNYEQCFECGTCYVVCNREGAISWSYPAGGMGVVFHHG